MKRKKVYGAVLYPSVLISLILLLPFLFLLFKGVTGASLEWDHISENLLTDYVWNTLKILISVSLLSLLWSVLPAYLVSRFTFPGSRFFSWALVAPLAIPTFIMAIIYSGISDVTGPISQFMSLVGLSEGPFYFDILNIWGLSFTLSFALYPYIYLSTLMAFKNRSFRFEETALNLGLKPIQVFFKVTLRMALPFILTGMLLVMMELLNDYGAMKYYGYNTLTTGIFKAWFDLNDLTSAIYLSGVLFLFVFVLLFIKQKNKLPASDQLSGKQRNLQLKGWKKWSAFSFCFFTFFFAFILPAGFIIHRGISHFTSVVDPSFIQTSFISIVISFITAFMLVVLALLFSESKRIHVFQMVGIFI